MNRRQYLTTVASLGSTGLLAGCSSSQATQETETDSPWPTEVEDPSPKKEARKWNGGHQDASMSNGVVVLDDYSIEVLAGNVAQQVGVCTTETDIENSENIPESEFDWYSASEGSYIWFIYLNFFDHDGQADIELPPAARWGAEPILDGSGNPTKPFTAAFDPDPTYYRLPGRDMGDYTQPAYANVDVSSRQMSTMVFEVPSDAIYLLYGDSPRLKWSFNVE